MIAVALLLPFLGGLLTALLPTRARTMLAAFAALVSLVAAGCVVSL